MLKMHGDSRNVGYVDVVVTSFGDLPMLMRWQDAHPA